MTGLELLALIASDPEEWRATPLEVLRSLSSFAAQDGYSHASQDVLLRILPHRAWFRDYGQILDSLVREFGLFPYVERSDRLSLFDRVAIEAHRTNVPHGDKTIVFHREQAEVLHALMQGHNVVLSAPTSFGKSLIVDALIASQRYRNIVVVVPTIALIDETRRRLKRFSAEYTIVTHAGQRGGERNVFVLTQERVLELMPDQQVDLFIVDEFYKLSPALEGDEESGRTTLLNYAFYRLQRSGAQFYLLGPNIGEVGPVSSGTLDAEYFRKDYRTVACDVIVVDKGGSQESRLLGLLPQLTESTIVYCRGPGTAHKVAALLSRNVPLATDPLLDSGSEWIASEFHPEWTLTSALRHRIGVHHSQVPRALGQLMVRLFNDGRLKFLVCTSSLIEGVNTAAKNVVLYDNRIGATGRRLDFFSFSNIKGRSGRMFRHFVGKVYLFQPGPAETWPDVDVPVLSQHNAAPELLIQMDPAELLPNSKQRLEPFLTQRDISAETLKANTGVSLEAQMNVARELRSQPKHHAQMLAWGYTPSFDQIQHVVELMSSTGLAPLPGGVTARAATRFVDRFRDGERLAAVVAAHVNFVSGRTARGRPPSADDAIVEVLGFYRKYLTFGFPRGLRALDLIQRDVFARLGVRVSNSLARFAGQADAGFMSPTAFALDEFGIPLPLVQKLLSHLPGGNDLDATLDAIRSLDVSRLHLSTFERELLASAKDGL